MIWSPIFLCVKQSKYTRGHSKVIPVLLRGALGTLYHEMTEVDIGS